MQFPPQLIRQNHSDFYGRCLLALCLIGLVFATGTVEAKGSRAHPIKKIDTTPNLRGEDVWTFTLESNTYRGAGVPETNSGNEFYGTVGFALASKSF